MFAARGIGVSLAIFVLLYIPLSLIVSRAWRFLSRLVKPQSARSAALALFALRILPFALSSIFTLVFTLPSFLLLEPRATNESVGVIPVALGLFCLLGVVVGVVRAIAAQRATSQALMKWLDGSIALDAESRVPVYRTGKDAPTLTVAGVCDPKVLVSEATIAALSSSELHAALKHELAHVRSHDNLKKLLFRLSAFPGMSALEGSWSEQAELAADDAAVGCLDDALNLASALIKVSRLSAQPAPILTTGLLHSSTALQLRVKRLFSWCESHRAASSSGYTKLYAAVSAMVTLVLVASTYSSALTQLHTVTEWLVR
jgi:Zn-dependent protease with chaperone function